MVAELDADVAMPFDGRLACRSVGGQPGWNLVPQMAHGVIVSLSFRNRTSPRMTTLPRQSAEWQDALASRCLGQSDALARTSGTRGRGGSATGRASPPPSQVEAFDGGSSRPSHPSRIYLETELVPVAISR